MKNTWVSRAHIENLVLYRNVLADELSHGKVSLVPIKRLWVSDVPFFPVLCFSVLTHFWMKVRLIMFWILWKVIYLIKVINLRVVINFIKSYNFYYLRDLIFEKNMWITIKKKEWTIYETKKERINKYLERRDSLKIHHY